MCMCVCLVCSSALSRSSTQVSIVAADLANSLGPSHHWMCTTQPQSSVVSSMSMSANGSIPAFSSSDPNPTNSSSSSSSNSSAGHHHHHSLFNHHHNPQPQSQLQSHHSHSQLQLDDFGDDFDVSLSGLCLSSTESPLIRDINQVFSSFAADIVKVEEDPYSPGQLGSSCAQHQGLGHCHSATPPLLSPTTPNTSSTNDQDCPTDNNNNVGSSSVSETSPSSNSQLSQQQHHHHHHHHQQQHHHHHHQRSPHPQSHPQLSHLHQSTHQSTHHNPQHDQQQQQSIQSPSSVSSYSHISLSASPADQLLVHQLEAFSQQQRATGAGGVVDSLFDTSLDQSFYSPMQESSNSQLEDDSCQSTYTSSDAGSQIANNRSLKPLQLATVLENYPQCQQHDPDQDKPNSKRICFKAIVDKDDLPQQHQQQLAVATLSSQISLSPLAASLEQRISPELTDSIYSTLNVANSYGYAWRRWSKTDAPVVKNKAGSVQVPHTMAKIAEDKRRQFQYVLGAPTAAGTKIGLPTMTYLNQGQSYEIRVKKLKKNPNDDVNLQSCVRLGFVEKRLQYREDEEMDNWSAVHSKDRLLDIDFTMSYGVFEIDLAATKQNVISFVWNPKREASIFIKVNCISTEFTSKRHGGERGAPLRLVVDTYSIGDSHKLDAASCLIKVFKSKGAERKHKTDRDRMAKHPDAELYYQPSYDCTLLTRYKEEPLIPPSSANASDASNCEASFVAASGQGCQGQSPGLLSPGGGTCSSSAEGVVLVDGHGPSSCSTGGGGGSQPQSLSSGVSPIPLDHHHHQQQHHLIQDQTPPPAAVSPGGGGGVKCEPLSAISSPISTTDHQVLSSSNVTLAAQSSPSQLPQSSSVSTSDANDLVQCSVANPSALSFVACHYSSQQHGDDGPFSPKSATQSSSSGGSSSNATLSHDADAQQTYHWLQQNRFSNLAEQLSDYTADDLRRLSRDDLIQLCDPKDGIRLFNLIHTPQSAITKLTIFITLDGSEHFALFFKSLTIEEFREKLSESFSDCLVRIRHMHLIGPNGIRVKLTNNVIQNMKNESIYYCILNKVDDEFDLVLRLTTQSQ